MSAAKHTATAAPWQVDEEFGLIIGPKGEEVCAVHAGVPDGVTGRVQIQTAAANARLIAAAPELLELARFAVTEDGACAERNHKFALKRLAAITDAARAALRQAEGGA